MSDPRKDTWGKWGFVMPLVAIAFASVMFAAVGNLMLGLQRGIDNPFNLFFISLYGVLAIVLGLALVWTFRARRRWLESIASGP